ncbi:hypothetical protein [Corynebacterium rouxii]|uniref:Uncharacterized protein n=1 Tax=Corynebacterium rouxii TaxID=2719119 RepID=A0A6I8MHG7_9CORY|nr:hypothetical protein [Corynebacterium rouxii]MDT9411307.1 hypothetical protein [Corynebacterium rouxii]VZH85309.1 hypothetical protein FRC0190_01275 [Corynebacterium rouxii]
MTNSKKTPAQAEATGDNITFEVEVKDKKITLTAPASLDDAPVATAIAWEEEKFVKAFSLILGPQQMQKLTNAGATVRDFTEVIMPAYTEATGLGED